MVAPAWGDQPRSYGVAEYTDAWSLLEQVRLRTAMWVQGRQHRALETMLAGYGLALEAHGIDEQFRFDLDGHFSAWLYARFGWGMACGWAYAIEENAGADDPLDLFFRLVDVYRTDAYLAPSKP